MAGKSNEPGLPRVAGGRTVEEQTDWVRKHGYHANVPLLRDGLLEALGIPRPKPEAKNIVIFGCYVPFYYSSPLQASLRLLDILGVDYTYLENEVCCGAPMVQATSGDKRKQAMENAKGFMQTNLDKARQKGAGGIAYWCNGCSHMSKGLLSGDTRHVYILDLILENLGSQPLRVSPTVIGYFEGCHTRYRNIFPQIRLNWEDYRRRLDRVEGLKVVDLPNNICCTRSPEQILEAAEKQNLDTILCPCNGCLSRLRRAGQNRLQVRHYVELLLEAMGRTINL